MLLWIMGFLDLLSLIAILGMHYDIIGGWRFPFICIVYLLIKGIAFFGDILSIIDILFAVYMIIMLVFNVQWFLTYIAIAYFVYKAIISFIPSGE